MTLEATVICVDNSEWMRNGDYPPSRLDAQSDAVNLLCGAKTQSHPDNTVGLMTSAGRGPQVLVTPTQDVGLILSALHKVQIGGESNIMAALRIGQLVLKHRQNKDHRQRIVLFIGSPVSQDAQTLTALGGRLKKSAIAVDIINFGEENDNTEKLEAFINAVNNNDNSHLVTVPPGPHILSDILLSSPIISGGGEMGAPGGGGGGAPGGGPGFEFGVDPNLDPELALALRISMEEERLRQQRAAAESGAGPSGEVPSSSGGAAVVPAAAAPTTAFDAPMATVDDELYGDVQGDIDMDEDELLRQALLLSEAGADPVLPVHTTTASAPAAAMVPADIPMDDDDEEMRLALQLSMEAAAASSTPAPQQPSSNNSLGSLLSGLPGIDMNDDRIKKLMDEKSEEKKDDKK